MPTAKPTRRSRPLRCEEPEHLFFVTTRTLEEVFWLHPLLCSRLAPVNREARRVVEAKRSRLRTKLERLVASANRRRPENQPKLSVEEAEKLAEDCVSSALARAQEHCAERGLPPVEVFAVVVMSNHLHLVVRAPGKNLAAFMGYFLARVAQTLNLLLGRVGPVFPRRYDAQPILDEEAAAGRVKYVLENPKKAGLVCCFTEWPGFVAVAGLHEGEELETKHFDRTGWQLAKRPKERARYWRQSRLKLSRLPGMESLSRAAYLATVKSWCDSRPAERCLGVEGVLDADVNQRPKKPKRSRRPYAFGRPESVDAYREASRLRYAAYDAVRALAKIGERVEWPEGMYAPGGAVAA
jgi:REP element-mobilizing transposase RayT